MADDMLILISNLKNGYSVSTNYTGASYVTRVLDGLENTQDEITGDPDLPTALETHARMIRKYR